MSKKVLWNCDTAGCSHQKQAGELPTGWLSLVFVNSGKEYRYCFCSYHCLIGWATKQDEYYRAKSTDNRIVRIP